MQEYRNILVHCLVNIGDVILSTSAVALLRQAYPAARITMMVRQDVAGLLQNHPVIDEVLVFDYKNKQRSILAQLRFLGELKKRQFDLVISFDRKLRPALLTWLAGIPTRVAPEKVFDDKPSQVTKFYTDIIPIKYDLTTHLQADTYQEIVRKFCGINGVAAPVLGAISNASAERARDLVARLPKDQLKVALCVKGTFALKNWPLERFAQLVDRINAKFAPAFFVVGAPQDGAFAAALAKLVSVEVANFCGETTLPELLALFKQSDLFITVDTGAAHIAATTGIPMVVMYGCTSPRRWAPINPQAVAISKEPGCLPCNKGETECDMRDCLQQVTVDEVFEAALTYFNLPQAR